MTEEQKDTAPLENAIDEPVLEEENEEIIDTPSAEKVTATSQISDEGEEGTRDYEQLIREDIRTLLKEFPELPENFEISELNNPVRFGALRDLGLSAKEAFLATGGAKRKAQDNRAHLTASVPRGAVSSLSPIPRGELNIARQLFSDMSEGELERLYRKVSQR